MYRDPGFDQNPYHLEQKLSKLESDASEIILRAYNQFAQGLILELERIEVDKLRRFLFLMKYRKSGMFARYNHGHIDNYNADDRERMAEYMRSRGFSKPRDVWFDNLREFLDLEMDPAKAWIETLKTRIYPDDAMMMILHLTHSFLALCEPMSSDDEFLLTENAYAVFEGPSTETLNPLTQESNHIYNEYHNFAPLSPRLMIVLRSHLLGSQDQVIGSILEPLLEAARSQHLYPDKAGSILQDLPIRNCDTVYAQKNITSIASLRPNDRFCFQCFKISSRHITVINNILLEEAYTTSSIVFHSQSSLKVNIERYLEDDTLGMKNTMSSPFDERRLYLITLERIMRQLGGSTVSKTRYFHPGVRSPQIHRSLSVAARLAIELLQSEETESSIPPVYSLLKPGKGSRRVHCIPIIFKNRYAGASRKTFWNDVHQASLMLLLRIKVDVILKDSSLNDLDKDYVRLSRQRFFMEFPIERLWLYFKIARNMGKFDLGDFNKQIADLELLE
jgi:hypothetical protein